MSEEFQSEGLNVRCTCGQLVPVVRVVTFPDGVERIWELWRELQKITLRYPRTEEREALYKTLTEWQREIEFYAHLYAPHVKKENPVPWYKRLFGGKR